MLQKPKLPGEAAAAVSGAARRNTKRVLLLGFSQAVTQAARADTAAVSAQTPPRVVATPATHADKKYFLEVRYFCGREKIFLRCYDVKLNV